MSRSFKSVVYRLLPGPAAGHFDSLPNPTVVVKSLDRMFTCGFEEGDLLTTTWNRVTGTAPPVLDQGTVRTGGYSIKFTHPASGNAFIERDILLTDGSQTPKPYSIFVRGYYNFTGVWPVTIGTGVSIIKYMTDTVTGAGLILKVRGDQKLQLFNRQEGSSVIGAFVLQAGVWYRIETSMVVDAAGNTTYTVRLFGPDDSTLLDTLTLSEVLGGTLSNFGAIRFGDSVAGVNNQLTYYLEDIAIQRDPQTWCGPGHIVLAIPDTDVAVQWGRVGAGGANYIEVDDLPGAANDTDYVATSSPTAVDRYGLHTTVPIPAGAFPTWVDVRCRMMQVSGAPTLALDAWDHLGTQYVGAAMTPNLAFDVVPYGGHLVLLCTNLTRAQLLLFNIGVQGVAAATERRVSALWANVEYTT